MGWLAFSATDKWQNWSLVPLVGSIWNNEPLPLVSYIPQFTCMCIYFGQVSSSIGRWILEGMGVYNPYSGVTTNQSESFNSVLKRLQSWREVSVDAIVLALYQLQAFYTNEVQRGFAGLGNFSLSAEFAAARRPAEEIVTIATFQPDEIVARIQQRSVPVIVNTEGDKQGTENLPPEEDDFSPPSSTQHSRARYSYSTDCFCSWGGGGGGAL